jgi:hypothetical protein
MSNIPGATNVLPGVFSDVVTQSRGTAVPGGIRISALIGEGSRTEVIVSSAIGGGKDGLNPSYTSSNGSDGRHFKLSLFPLVSNRTKIFRNGVPLVGLESPIDSNPFSNLYDYRLDKDTGKLEMQRAYIVDQGGAFYVAAPTNVGVGVINGLQLLDANAPSETWSIRCVSVQRDSFNVPILNTAKFVAVGSVSGSKLDANGNPVIWIANNQVVDNGILKFSIDETTSTAFREGDVFTIKVKSGVLTKNDSLTAEYIAISDLNDPEFLESMEAVSKKHGAASLDNNLTLGCQLAFSNSAPGIMCVQAAPPMPRRQSFLLVDDFKATSTNNDDFTFALPVGVKPDTNSNIHFFVINNTTNVETQVLPNKLTYYTLDTPGFPTTSQFTQDNNPAPLGYSFFYTVVSKPQAMVSALDGYIARDPVFNNKGIFSTPSFQFDSSHVGKTLKIFDATNVANNGQFTINSVSDGKLFIGSPSFTYFPPFNIESGLSFQIVDANTLVSLGSANDGYTASPVNDTATFGSSHLTGLNFGTITNITTRKLKINSGNQKGLYDIIGYNPSDNTITIQKTFVIESNLRYEVIDPANSGYFIVVNHNVVPNGYSLRVTLVDEKDASFYDAGWLNALESLEKVECDIVVPLPKQTPSVIFQNALTHCKTMSNIRNRKERVLFIGAINGLTPDNLTGAKPAAVEDIGVLEGIQGDSITEILAGNIEDLTNYSVPDSFGNTFRCVYFYPDQIVVQAGSENVLVDGFYIAAAAAGYLSAITRVEVPLTNKVLTGFTILRNKLFSQTILENLAAAGVTTLQPVQGGGNVVWGLTTTQSGFPEEQEISIVFIRDRIAKSMRAGFKGFIGIPEDNSTFATLSARAIGLLNSFIAQGLITAYRDLKVQRDSVDPRQWNIQVHVQPTYPVNWIYIKVGIGIL